MWEKRWGITVGMVVIVSTAILGACAGPQPSMLQSPEQTLEAPQGAKVLFTTEAGTTIAPQTSNRISTTNTHVSTPSKPRNTSQGPQARLEPAPAPRAETKSPQGGWLGFSYWVEWVQTGGTPKRIEDPARFVFQSGDRVRFHITTNMEGYLYVLNEGSSGQSTVLFPHASMIQQHPRVEARKEVIVPSQGWIRFDQKPGEEGIRFILSRVQVTDILGTTQNPVLSQADSGRLVAALDQQGSKDLLVEADEAEGQKATYAVIPIAATDSPQEGGPMLVYRTRLFHQ